LLIKIKAIINNTNFFTITSPIQKKCTPEGISPLVSKN